VAIARSAWSAGADWLLFKSGPVGVDRGSHAHMDALEFLWQSATGFRIVDRGTESYNGEDALREASTSTREHNTAFVDGLSQASRVGRFAWNCLPAVEGGPPTESAGAWSASGTARYEAGGFEILHRRRIEASEPGIGILDRLECAGRHRAGATLRFAGELEWHAETRLLVGHRGKLRLSWEGWQAPAIERATWSRSYGRREPATVVRFAAGMLDTFEGRIRLECADD
jgi:hypothetical protein